MKNFTSFYDLGSIERALSLAYEVKRAPFADQELGKNKTLLMLFFNSSLRTRLSTQKAAQNLGMNVIVLDINQGAWKLETQRGVIMDGDKPEHILEAIPVMGSYCDVIGVRAFASLTNREEDYNEVILNQFITYSGKSVVSMESSTLHPLQSYADLVTIDEFKESNRPKVVLTWAPHPKPLPQAVANSFAQWMGESGYDFVITHPRGYELSNEFTKNATIVYNQREAFEGADFIYAKNWSQFENEYGAITSLDRDWMVENSKMKLTNNAFFMHCLPVRRNMIVSDQVIESERSIVLQQAANRVVSAQAVLKEILKSI